MKCRRTERTQTPTVDWGDPRPTDYSRARRPRFTVLRLAVATAVGASVLGLGAVSASATMVSVTLSGSGTGKVVSSISGIACSNIPGDLQADCSSDFPQFSSGLKLTAVPGPGSAFMGWSGTGVGACVRAVSPCETSPLFYGMPQALDAKFGPKPDAPSVATGAATNVDFPSAKLTGQVNPNSNAFFLEDCRFEYGPTTAYGGWVPCRPTIGSGTNFASVSASIGVLEPETTYHYRLVASNGGGTTAGDDATLTTGPAPADPCPNADVRAQQGALGRVLPDCRAYEQVSPERTSASPAVISVVAADGNTGVLGSVGGFADTRNLPDLGVAYATARTTAGWLTTAIAPPATEFPRLTKWDVDDISQDLTRTLWSVNLKADEGTGRETSLVRNADGTFVVAGPPLTPGSGSASVSVVVGTTPDLDTVVTTSQTRPALTDGTTDTRAVTRDSLVASTQNADGSLSLRQVAYRAGATMFPTCAAGLGGLSSKRAAVSADGSKVFFTSAGIGSACSSAVNRRVWVKVGDADPIDLAETRCTDGDCGAAATAQFVGAARDGSRVYLATQQKLVNGDLNPAGKTDQNDLYEYDFDAGGEKLRPVTASLDVAGADFVGVTRISDDGAYVYFVAKGRALAGDNARGVAPNPGDRNLYVYHRPAGQANGTTTFVGRVGAADLTANRAQAMTSSSGRFLIFSSTADLTGEKQPGDTFSDLYRYDAQNDELRRIWSTDPAHNGSNRTGEPSFTMIDELQGGTQRAWSPKRMMSDDGATIAFSTTESLSPWDANQQPDVYMWRADTGRLTMLTDGIASAVSSFNAAVVTGYTGMSASGDSIFFSSYRPLLKGHTSGQAATFVVRRNGGFLQDPESTPCSGDRCQGSSAPKAGPVALAGSTAFTGPGNAVAPVSAAGSVTKKLRVLKAGAVRGASAKVRVRAPAKGRIEVSGSGLARASRSVGRAGTYPVAVRLSARSRSALRRTGRVLVRVQVRFAPSKGKSSSARVSVTFKAGKRPVKASSRAERRASVLLSATPKGR